MTTLMDKYLMSDQKSTYITMRSYSSKNKATTCRNGICYYSFKTYSTLKRNSNMVKPNNKQYISNKTTYSYYSNEPNENTNINTFVYNDNTSSRTMSRCNRTQHDESTINKCSTGYSTPF